MIIIDYSAISISAIIMAIKLEKVSVTDSFCKHMILNSIRGYNSKWKYKYGPIWIACDVGKSWRKNAYQYYKANRQKGRDDSDIDWDMIFGVMNQMMVDLPLHFGYHVISEPGAEADDIIGVMARMATQHRIPSIIVSNDKDFPQLHSEYVCQYRPKDKKIHCIDNPKDYLKEHIIKGDAGDGIPNIFSPDDVFVRSDIRQGKVTAKRLTEYMGLDPMHITDSQIKQNYFRNMNMIDLAKTPEQLINKINETMASSSPIGNQKTIMKWLTENRMRILLSRIQDFIYELHYDNHSRPTERGTSSAECQT